MHPLTKPLNRLKIPLRWVVILPLVFGIVMAVGLTGWLSLQYSQQMMTKAIAHLSQDMSDRIEPRLESYLDLPHRANQVTLSFLEQQADLWNPEDMSAIQQHFVGQISHAFPELMFLGGGGEQGEFAGVYQPPNGLLQIRRTDSTTDWVNVAKTWDVENPESTTILRVSPDYDPRKRSWYRQAMQQKRPVWSEIYANYGKGSQPVVSAALPFQDAAGRFQGVLVADVNLANLSEILRQLWDDFDFELRGHLFLFDRQGQLIAQSHHQATDLALFEREVQELKQQYGSLDAIATPQQLFLQHQGRDYWLGVTTIADDRGLDWLLALTLPPENLATHLQHNTADIWLLWGLALVLGSGVAIAMSQAIVYPIRRLSQASRALASGALPQHLPPSPIRELDAVARSFALMIQQLQQSQDTLEGKIQQRTQQLQQEVRDRQATEAQLREKQRALATLMSNLPGMAYRNSYDQHWTMAVVSEGCKELTGYPPQDLLGNRRISFENLTHPDDRAWVRRHIDAAVAAKKPFQLVYRIVTATGQAKWIWEKGQGIFDESGKAIALEGFMTDIDERKRTEDDLRDSKMKLKQAKEAAEQANQAKSIFLAKMSHELRTPLNGILGYTQILRRSREATLAEHQGLDVIYQCGTYLLTLINDILTLAKIDACKLELNLESCYLSQFLRDVVNLCQLKAAEKGIQLVTDLDADLPANVQIDRKRLQQVLLNLLDNAIKFTDIGRVTLRVQCLTTDPQASQQHLRFRVEDTGKGLTSEELAKIFLPFEQAGERRDRDLGLGLGLGIAQQLVQLMGGDLYARSVLGQGSVFSFDLSVTISQQPPVNGGDRLRLQNTLQGQKHKILIVEGDRDRQLQLLNWLQLLGFAVEVASTFAESCELLALLQPDLVILDATLLADMTALAAYQSPNNSAPIVLIVGQESPQTGHLSNARLAFLTTDFLAKPLQLPKLLDKIQQHLQLTWSESPMPNAIAPVNLATQPTDFPHLPDPEILQQWLNLAKRGRLLDLEKAVRLMQQNHPCYQALTESLLDWCQNFQLSTIKQFLHHVLASNSDCG